MLIRRKTCKNSFMHKPSILIATEAYHTLISFAIESFDTVTVLLHKLWTALMDGQRSFRNSDLASIFFHTLCITR